jgi:phosphoglycolate phosphatase-like HAD superfamily hydrolase
MDGKSGKASGVTMVNRPWDSFDAYLFDIDGTLLVCNDAVHYHAFCHTMQMIAGKPMTLEGVIAHGNTDIGILRDAFALAGVADDAWRPRLPLIRQTMNSYVRGHRSELCTVVLPHVREVLEHLRSRGACLGVATGNLREIGHMKLARAGLAKYLSFGGWSDACEYRRDVFQQAVALAKAMTHDAASLCVVGDTPADIRAAHENGVPVIAVSTGVYSYAQLCEEQPEWCVSSLGELLHLNQAVPA